MTKYLIHVTQSERRTEKGKEGLHIMECFYDTIQGEGVSAGTPAVFLRLQHCTLDCIWCDTQWRRGGYYTHNELLDMMEKENVVGRLRNGHRLILTGGSPLRQQHQLVEFLKEFSKRFLFMPTIEVENECVLYPYEELASVVYQWNNSPKLANSGMKERARYKPDIIKYTSKLNNSWFKFVVGSVGDWEEILEFFVASGLIKKEQIILMPLADSLQQLQKNHSVAMWLAIREGVKFSTRQQLILNVP